MATFGEIMRTIGRAAATAGAFIGRKAAEGYRFVDPDLRRHIFQTPLLAHTLFISTEEELEPQEPDGHPPLVFVHGLGGNRGNFFLMSKYLAFYGRKRSYKIHFKYGLSIEEMAAELTGFVEKVKEITGSDKVDIVAHSLGGLVARLAICELGLDRSVSRFITLGTPHKGSFPARLAASQRIMDLRPESELIKRLERVGLPEGVRCFSLWSKSDLLVLPPESAILEGSEAIEAKNFTHYSYLLDPSCWASVAALLKA